MENVEDEKNRKNKSNLAAPNPCRLTEDSSTAQSPHASRHSYSSIQITFLKPAELQFQ